MRPNGGDPCSRDHNSMPDAKIAEPHQGPDLAPIGSSSSNACLRMFEEREIKKNGRAMLTDARLSPPPLLDDE